MHDETRSRLREVFEAATELPIDERDAFLRAACAGDDALRAEVEDLLRHDADSGTEFLQSPMPRAPADSALPATIGRYRVTGRLGTGGMGIVYEGAQESPQRAVAIKVIRAETMSERLLARFRNEAEILGRLEHPGIARIYEAGTFDGSTGASPFFAMELVRGVPLLDHAPDLAVTERLRLFAEVCDAVHHAHQKGVIHRDLKPANILVTADGQPKVLDFGVARATDGDLNAVTMQTDIGQILGTVPYMSPEQISGDLARLDTRSDVYALGVVLFELLTGALPHDVRERSIPEAARIIRDEDSTRLSTIVPALRGDLEWIVGMALEKDVGRRYDSASALAADIRRHLADEPVLAGPPSATYRMRKFARRNRAGVAWAAAFALLLAAGVAATAAQAVRATRAEQSARSTAESWRRESDRGRLSADFLVWALANSAPEDTPTIHRTLDAASARIEDRFGGNAGAEADVRRLMGDVYHQIGAYDQAKEQLLGAYEIVKDSEQDRFRKLGLYEVLTGLQSCERELGNGEAAAIRWYLECLTVLEGFIDEHDRELASALRDMRRDLDVREGIVAADTRLPLRDQAPARTVQDQCLERVMAAYAQTTRRDDVGRGLALHLMYVTAYLGNVFGEANVSYARAQIKILDDFESLRVGRQLGMALWIEARIPAPPGDEDRRVRVARRLVEGDYGYVGWWLQDFEILLGDALVQRGNDDDQAEIVDLLTTGVRSLRELAVRDAGTHALLDMRLGQALMRLASFGHGTSVVHLLDQPEILDELQAGLEVMSNPMFHMGVAQSMHGRQGRSDRWYEVAVRATGRARELQASLQEQDGSG